MAAVGLSAFTTGDLYTWVTANNGQNIGYLRLPPSLVGNLQQNFHIFSDKQISQGSGVAAFPIMDIILGVDATFLEERKQWVDGYVPLLFAPDSPNYTITNWRKACRNSHNLTFRWIHDQDQSDWKINFEETVGTSNQTTFDVSNLDLTGPDINPVLNADGYSNASISRIIEINELVIEPRYLESSTDSADAIIRAGRSSFIRDIKNSFSGGMNWANHEILHDQVNLENSKLIFNNINGDPCPQDVDYKLSLYSRSRPKPDQFSVTNPSMNFVTKHNPTDSEGRPGTDSLEVAGSINLKANNITGKLESGSQAVIAVMLDDLPAATPPDAGLLKATPENYMDCEKGFKMERAAARVLSFNGKNPNQLTAQYVTAKSTKENPKTEEELEELQIITCTNRLTNQTFERGMTVVAHEIDGLWQPMSVIPVDPGPVAVATEVGNWDFMYLTSNADHYFRPADTAIYVGDRESQFANYYYKDNVPAVKLEVENSYVQFTSWDAMGQSVGGLRKKHALGQTQFSRDVLGNSLTSPEEQPGTSTAPFFGCVFPEGYELGNKFDLYTSKVAANSHDAMSVRGGDPSNDYMRDIPEQFIIFYDIVDDSNPPTLVYKNDNGNTRMADTASDAAGIKSIFSAIRNNNKSLHQLPADIALNAHPDSAIGAPLTILKELEYAFSFLEGINHTPAKCQQRVSEYLSSGDGSSSYKWDTKRYAWLENSANGDSTFEFKPKQTKHIQFRPLKAEVYSVFEHDQDTRVERLTSVAPPDNKSMTHVGRVYRVHDSSRVMDAWPKSEENRGSFCTQAYKSIDISQDPQSPYHKNIIDRAIIQQTRHGFGVSPFNGIIGKLSEMRKKCETEFGFFSGGWNLTCEINKEPLDLGMPYGLKCNVDIAENGNLLNFNTNDAPFPYEMWDQDWCKLGSKSWAGGAVGIIGATCRVTANNAINFTTRCFYGMGSIYHPGAVGGFSSIQTFGGFGLAGIALGTAIGIENAGVGGSKPWYGTFGGKGHQPESFHETALHARIYHHWPKRLTVYDPRYFAIYHFADGVGDEFEHRMIHLEEENIDRKYYYKGEEVRGFTVENPSSPSTYTTATAKEEYEGTVLDPTSVHENLSNVDVEYPDGKYQVDQMSDYNADGLYPSDFREPTITITGHSFEVLGITYNDEIGILAPPNGIVYSDGLLKEQWSSNKFNPWRDPDDWVVNIEARGKLLPTQGINTTDIVLRSGPDGEAIDIHIDDLGTGYALDAVFTTDGGSGKGVLLMPIFDTLGTTIEGFKIDNAGTGFRPEDFFTYEEITQHVIAAVPNDIISYSQSKDKVRIIEVDNAKVAKGEGLKAFVLRGGTITKEHVTPKPLRATEDAVHTLSIRPPQPLSASPQNQKPIRDTNPISVDIPPQRQNTNNDYDIFLHFHNDISHTFIDPTWGSTIGPTYEQAIDLTISPV